MNFRDSLTDDQKTVHDALCESSYLSGAKAGWNAAHMDDPITAMQKIENSREGYMTGMREATTRIIKEIDNDN